MRMIVHFLNPFTVIKLSYAIYLRDVHRFKDHLNKSSTIRLREPCYEVIFDAFKQGIHKDNYKDYQRIPTQYLLGIFLCLY